jgi:hypothetical protein
MGVAGAEADVWQQLCVGAAQGLAFGLDGKAVRNAGPTVRGCRLCFTFSDHTALHLFEQLYAMNFLGATDGLKSEGVDGEAGDGSVLESCGA